MVLSIFKKDKKKTPPLLRNQAVQTVGEVYFLLSMVGLVAAGVLSILAVALGSTRGMFKFELDRCDCLLTSSFQPYRDAGESCVFGDDFIGVNIGWKSFVVEDAVSTDGCLDGWEGTTDIGTPFGDGVYAKKSSSYGNGATGAADASVWLFVLSAIVAIIMYKTVKMSYVGPGSIYSIGLHNIAGMCLLLSIASGISITAFWGRIQGKLGSLNASLSTTLFKATIDVCEEDWGKVPDLDFCDAKPWSFEVPLFAGMLAIAHVGVMFFTAVWLLTRSAFVEGLLDGSILVTGKPVTPRVVEYEQAVGKALATSEDPDYDADNMLYTGEQNIMIRPYPLPCTVKKNATKLPVPLESPLRQMTQSPNGGKATSGWGSSAKLDPQESSSPTISDGGTKQDGDISEEAGSRGGTLESDFGSHGPIEPVPKLAAMTKAEEKAAAKAAKKANKKAKKKGKSNGESGVEENLQSSPGHARANSRSAIPKMPQLGRLSLGRKAEVDHLPPKKNESSKTHNREPSQVDWSEIENGDERSDGEDSETGSFVALSEGSLSSALSVPPGKGGGRHEKTRSEIDWNSIMASGGGTSNDAESGIGATPDSSSPASALGDLIDQLPSTRDGLGLGAITEDPREDMISEFTMSPRTRGSATQFEV